jgi:hypothetical protein
VFETEPTRPITLLTLPELFRRLTSRLTTEAQLGSTMIAEQVLTI